MGVYGILFLSFLAAAGAAFGSFACCQAWRIRLKAEGKRPGRWSVCMNCGHRLSWFENVPIISWTLLRGRCRKCGEKIGRAEILSEISMLLIFLFAGLYFSPIGGDGAADPPRFALLFIFLTLSVPLMILAVYDAKWGELPVGMLALAIILSVCYFAAYEFFRMNEPGFLPGPFAGRTLDIAALPAAQKTEVLQSDLFGLLASVGVLAGTYYLIYFFSHEKMAGGGDWLLSLSVALMLGAWPLALVELFLSNALAAAAMLPAAVKGRSRKKRGEKRRTETPFGPYLVLAAYVVFFLQNVIKNAFLIR